MFRIRKQKRFGIPKNPEPVIHFTCSPSGKQIRHSIKPRQQVPRLPPPQEQLLPQRQPQPQLLSCQQPS